MISRRFALPAVAAMVIAVTAGCARPSDARSVDVTIGSGGALSLSTGNGAPVRSSPTSLKADLERLAGPPSRGAKLVVRSGQDVAYIDYMGAMETITNTGYSISIVGSDAP